MSRPERVRVVVYAPRSAGPALHRTLISLARQDLDPARLEIAFPTSKSVALDDPKDQLLVNALDLKRVEVVDDSGLTASQAINLAAQGSADHIAFVPEGARLHPEFLTRLLGALPDSQLAAAFCGHTAGNAEGIAYVRSPAYQQEMLTRRNPIGPAVLIKAQSWNSLHGLRADLRLHWWDLWLRLVMAGGQINQVPDLLASCPSGHRWGPKDDGTAKAMLVVQTPGAFAPDVCRWALAHLRGDSWATSFTRGRIPTPRDVAELWSGFNPALRTGAPGWERPLSHSA